MEKDWFIILAAIISNAFFSGIEMAFLSSNKLKVELKHKQGGLPARIISYFVKKPANFIAVMLVGSCVSLVVYSIFMEKWKNDFQVISVS